MRPKNRAIYTAIYKDFAEFIKPGDLCKLTTMNFDLNELPDYKDKNIQQYYLLRYAYAYVFEYMTMYQYLFKQFENKEVKIVSFGCGSFLDYYGARMAAGTKLFENMIDKIYYTGYDLADWEYKLCAFESDQLKFSHCHIQDIRSEVLSADIYFFPKSISEFDDKSISRICDIFAKSTKTRNKIYLAVSLRGNSNEEKKENDKINLIIESLSKNNYSLSPTFNNNEFPLFKNHEFTFNKFKGIKGINKKFNYPEVALATIKNLNNNCGNNSCNKKEKCHQKLVRQPILNNKLIKFKLFEFIQGE